MVPGTRSRSAPTARLRCAPPAARQLPGHLELPVAGAEVPEIRAKARELQALLTGTIGNGRWREDAEILAWFGDWELVEPGLVPLADWRPPLRGRVRRDEIYHGFYGGVARKK